MSRADRVAGRLSEKGVDLLLVTHLPNLRYLTGFTGSNGMAVVGDGVRRFVNSERKNEDDKGDEDRDKVDVGEQDVSVLQRAGPQADFAK